MDSYKDKNETGANYKKRKKSKLSGFRTNAATPPSSEKDNKQTIKPSSLSKKDSMLFVSAFHVSPFSSTF